MPAPFNNPAWLTAAAGLAGAVLRGVAAIIGAWRNKR
jgi:hypothetical protein